MVAVAQLVEPWIVIPVVVGSSPISHPNFHTINQQVDSKAFSLTVSTNVFCPSLVLFGDGPSQLNEQASPRCFCNTQSHNLMG